MIGNTLLHHLDLDNNKKFSMQEIKLYNSPKRSHTYEYGEKHFVCITRGVCLEFDKKWDAEMTVLNLRKCGLISA